MTGYSNVKWVVGKAMDSAIWVDLAHAGSVKIVKKVKKGKYSVSYKVS